jgi:hypothetical protein
MGIAISYPPERIDNAHAHSADSGEQAAGRADQKGEAYAKRKKRLGKEKGRQQTCESYADDRDK